MKILRYQKEDGTVPLTEWLSALRDLQARIAIRRRLDRFADGNPGNTRALLLIRQALFVNLARAEVSKPLDGLKLNGIGTLQ